MSKHGLGEEKLGRFAPTLRNMTRVIWNTPLEAYTQFSLGEIRAMKTHGEKRVRAILEVFHSVHVLVANMGMQDHLVVRIFPRLIDSVEAVDRPRLADARAFRPLRNCSSTSSARCWSRSAPMPRSRSPAWRRIGWAFPLRSRAFARRRGPWG